MFGYQEAGVKVGLHTLQNSIRGEFQEYAERFNWGFTDTRDFPLEKINPEIPIRVIFATEDELCPRDTQLPFLQRVPSFEMEVSIPGAHSTASGANGSDFMSKLRSLLVNSDAVMSSEICSGAFEW